MCYYYKFAVWCVCRSDDRWQRTVVVICVMSCWHCMWETRMFTLIHSWYWHLFRITTFQCLCTAVTSPFQTHIDISAWKWWLACQFDKLWWLTNVTDSCISHRQNLHCIDCYKIRIVSPTIMITTCRDLKCVTRKRSLTHLDPEIDQVGGSNFPDSHEHRLSQLSQPGKTKVKSADIMWLTRLLEVHSRNVFAFAVLCITTH